MNHQGTKTPRGKGMAAASAIAEAVRLGGGTLLGLSATPVYNYGDEIFNILEVLSPERLGTREEFHWEWCENIRGDKWAGPWTEPKVPMRVRYRKTHWVAVRPPEKYCGGWEVFDINVVNDRFEQDGWMPWHEWKTTFVPWLIQACEIKGATGEFWPTHVLRIDGKWQMAHGTGVTPPGERTGNTTQQGNFNAEGAEAQRGAKA